jgi:hypothetical protein
VGGSAPSETPSKSAGFRTPIRLAAHLQPNTLLMRRAVQKCVWLLHLGCISG